MEPPPSLPIPAADMPDADARLSADPAFAKIDMAATLNAQHFIGRAPQQVDEFLSEVVDPIRARYAAGDSLAAEVKV